MTTKRASGWIPSAAIAKSARESAATDGLGAVLANRYDLVEVLGTGGMAVVYRALDRTTARFVVVKVLVPALRENETSGLRFRREATILAALGHPGLPRILDAQLDGPAPAFLVMPYEPGQTLRARLAQCGSLAPQRAARIGCEILSALRTAHERGIVHRDIKPANLYLARSHTGEDCTRVLDFGVAKLLGDIPLLTEAGASIGTLAYMPPEQARGEAIGAAADIYAVGATLYHALTGRRPFVATVPRELYQSVVGDVPPAIEDLVFDVPSGLANVVHRALAKDPAQRFESASAMIDALLPFAHDCSVRSSSTPLADDTAEMFIDPTWFTPPSTVRLGAPSERTLAPLRDEDATLTSNRATEDR